METNTNNEQHEAQRSGNKHVEVEAETLTAERLEGDPQERKREDLVTAAARENHALLSPLPNSPNQKKDCVAEHTLTKPVKTVVVESEDELDVLGTTAVTVTATPAGEEKACKRASSKESTSISLLSWDHSVMLPNDNVHDGVTVNPQNETCRPEVADRPRFPVYRCEKAGCTCACRPCFFCQAVVSCRSHTAKCCSRFELPISIAIKCLTWAGLFAYLGFAFHYSSGDEPFFRLLGVTLLAFACWLNGKLSGSKRLRWAKRLWRKFRSCHCKHKNTLSWIAVGTVVTGVSYFLLVDVILRRPHDLTAALGILVHVIIFYVTSNNPAVVNWRTVGWGLVLQFGLSWLALRTRAGGWALNWTGQRVSEYLQHTGDGARFVFGASFDDHHFAFMVMSRIVFFSATMSVLWYYGIVQKVMEMMSWVMTFTLDTGPWESMHAALSAFMGWAETLMVVRPVLDVLSPSQLHTVMTNSYATLSGGVAAAFIQAGVPADYLLAAAFMSAPASLAISKLAYPDSPADKMRSRQREFPTHPQDTGFIQAVVSGAKSSLVVIGYLLVNVIAFMCVLAFLNVVFIWLARRGGLEVDEASVQALSSYLFWPFAFLMGVPSHDCGIVGRMLGLKLILSEVAGLHDLGTVHRNRLMLQNHIAAAGGNNTFVWTSAGDVILVGTNVTLRGGVLSPRSEVIAVFALCNYSDMYAYCVVLAALVSAAPSRKDVLVNISFRAWFCSIAVGYLSASMAGLMLPD